MKKLLLFLSVLILSYSLKSQSVHNPYASIGKPAPKVATLTNGAYDEFFTKDSLVLINNDAISRKTGDLVYSQKEHPEIIAQLVKNEEDKFRFLSIDPMAPEYPWYTPYQFAGNTPIWAIDLDGLEPAIFLGNNTQMSTIQNQNQNIPKPSQNWEPKVFVSISQSVIDIQNHKKLGNKVNTVFLQSHGSAGAIAIFGGADNKVDLTPVRQGGYYSNDDKTLNGFQLNHYLESKAKLMGMKDGKKKDKLLSELEGGEIGKQVQEFLSLTNEIEDGGTLILGGCHACQGVDGKELIESISKLVNNRITIVASNNYVPQQTGTGDAAKVLDTPVSTKYFFLDEKGWSETGSNGQKMDTNKDLQLNSSGDKTYQYVEPQK